MKKLVMSLMALVLIGGGIWARGGGDKSDGRSGIGTPDDPILIRYNCNNPPDSIMNIVATSFKEEAERRSGGRIKVEIYYSGQLAEATQNIPMIVRGNHEMSGSGATYISEYMPELGVLNMGYLYKNFEHADAFLNGEEGKKLFQRVADQIDFLPLGAYYYGARNVCINKDRAIKTPADLADIKLRTNGTDPMMFLARAMGANPVGISINEMYTAIQTGTVDGQENPINGVVTYKLYEVSKSLTYTRHFVDFSWIGIGYKFFRALEPELQQIIHESAATAIKKQSAAAIEAEQTNADFLISQGLKLYDVDTSAIRAQVLKAYESKAQQDGWDMDLFNAIQKVGENY